MQKKIKTVEESKRFLDKITFDLTESIRKKGIMTNFWFLFLICFTIVGVWAWIVQIQNGLGVTGMRDYVSWGAYIANFVFFVAISLIGFLISSVMHLLNIHWSKPISRVAEQVAIGAVALAGVIIVMDMGRPDRLLNVFFHARFSSPILWDVTVVMTYLAISLLLFYLPLIPDLAILRDRNDLGIAKWKLKIYKVLSLGWKGSAEQYKKMYHSMRVLMILIMPVGLSIHTVTAWLFASTLRAGWDTSIFGPYFVTGAFVAGVAAVMIVMYIYRLRYGLKDYYTDRHFDLMSKLLVLVCLIYLYFNINEFLVPGYKMKTADGIHLKELFVGRYATLFWFTQITGLILPIILLLIPYFRKPLPSVIISVFVVIAAWLKRYIIVVPTLEHPFLPIQNVPANFHHYFPTNIELTITFFPMVVTALIITLLAKIFPVIPIWEYAASNGISKETLNAYSNNQLKGEGTTEKSHVLIKKNKA